ncbi:hypothetical protein RRSWK_05793 [Rhodopirellula sp. SWK7]|nr:hypothetical protein RRSWK_05793 [Rhodopirellula sp. SWK7]
MSSRYLLRKFLCDNAGNSNPTRPRSNPDSAEDDTAFGAVESPAIGLTLI